MWLLMVSTFQPHFTPYSPKEVVFWLGFPIQMSYESEIKYVHLADSLDVRFGGLDFSTSFHTLAASTKRVFGRFFLLFKFASRITHLYKLELGS